MNIAIVALGASLSQYVDAVKLAGSRRSIFDETWVINSLGDTLAHDRVFHMDDVLVQEARAANGNKFISSMLDWLKTHPGPIYTSVVREGYPGLVAYPLQEVLEATNSFDWPWFNNTGAYPIAYAIYLGVKKISLYGFDYTYANRGHAEEGAACVAWWCRAAKDKGIEVRVASTSTCLDTCRPKERRLYGYDGMDVSIEGNQVTMTPRDLPNVQAIERRYQEAHKS